MAQYQLAGGLWCMYIGIVMYLLYHEDPLNTFLDHLVRWTWKALLAVGVELLLTGPCSAAPVPDVRFNPLMTEDDAIALMYRWKIGVRSSICIRGIAPKPEVRVTGTHVVAPDGTQGIMRMYHLGVDFGNPHEIKLPDGYWYQVDKDGFVDMGMGRTLEAAIRNAAYSGNLYQAEKDEVLRRK